MVPVLSMRWANAGKIPDRETMERELQKVAAVLTACDFDGILKWKMNSCVIVPLSGVFISIKK